MNLVNSGGENVAKQEDSLDISCLLKWNQHIYGNEPELLDIHLSQLALGFRLQGNVSFTVKRNVEQGRGSDILIQPHVLLHQVFTSLFPHI